MVFLTFTEKAWIHWKAGPILEINKVWTLISLGTHLVYIGPIINFYIYFHKESQYFYSPLNEARLYLADNIYLLFWRLGTTRVYRFLENGVIFNLRRFDFSFLIEQYTEQYWQYSANSTSPYLAHGLINGIYWFLYCANLFPYRFGT